MHGAQAPLSRESGRDAAAFGECKVPMKTLCTFVLAVLLAASLHAQAPGSQDAIWKQYFTWLKEGEPQTRTPQAYREKLIAEGMPEAQADERMALLHQLSTEHELEFVELFFDRIYADPQAPFNTEPNAFLVSETANLKPGTALDVAMGQGRNAIYLASKGWQVTGFDIAQKGLDVAQAEAGKRGLHITTVKRGYEDFDFGQEKWDLVVFCYAWAPLTDPALVERVRASMRPHGLVVIEHPAQAPPAVEGQGAEQHDPTDEVNALVKAWGAGFRIVHYEDTEGQWDWRVQKGRVLRLVAEKR